MTLSAGTGFNAIGREIFGFAPQIDFSAGSSGDDRTAFDFTSPTQLYMCELQPGINTSGMAINDICLLYTSPSPRDRTRSRMPSSA